MVDAKQRIPIGFQSDAHLVRMALHLSQVGEFTFKDQNGQNTEFHWMNNEILCLHSEEVDGFLVGVETMINRK